MLPLEFGRSTFRFAGPAGKYTDLSQLAGTRIATSYTGIVQTFLEERGIDATVTRLDGAVETSIQLGVADVIADVVETGSTLRQAGLETFGEAMLESEAVLITRSGAVPEGFEVFKRRLDGVLVARSYVMMDYDIEAARVNDAVALTPGIEGPTISPLHREGWVAVRAMVRRDGAQRLMDDLWDLGREGHHPHRHPRLPAVNAVPAPMPLPHTWRPLGPRIAGAVAGAVLVVMAVFLWFTFDAETRDAITPFQRGTVIVLGAVMLARALRAGPVARGRRRPTG